MSIRTVLMMAAIAGGLGRLARAQDFNGNSTRDAYDLRSGASPDCDRNGIPDEADLVGPLTRSHVEHIMDTNGATAAVPGLAAIDFDQDGDLDVVTSSRLGQNDSYLTLWRNDGGPGLVFHSRIQNTNTFCYQVRAADLNADGRTDIIAGDAGFAKVVVVLATGPGTFAAPVGLATAGTVIGLAVGDLDGDADIDIVATCHSQNAVNVFRNTGNGTFAARVSHTVGNVPTSVVIAELTGEGAPDLAVGNSNVGFPGAGTVTILRGTGSSFSTHATLPIPGHDETSHNSRPHDVGAADIDADGDNDLLVSARDSNSLTIWTNSGGAFSHTGTIGPLEVIGGIADRFVCVNLDDDAAPELAWGDSAAHAVRIFDNIAGTFVQDGSFAAATLGPVAIVAIDLTGDGVVDLATADDSSSTFSVLRGLGGLEYHAVHHIRRSDLAFYPMLAEFTGDGVIDLVTYSTFSVEFRVAPGLGDGRFGAPIETILPSAAPLIPRDVDADGDLDILGNGNSGNRYCMLNHGDGTFAAPIFSNPINIHGNVQTADMNNDGHLDFIWSWGIQSNLPHYIEISFGDGTGFFSPPQTLETPPFLGEVWTGDLTGDGYPELFVSVASGIVSEVGLETLLVYPNHGDGTFSEFVVHAYELAPNFNGGVGNFAWVDIDNDGDNDLVAASTFTWIYRNTNHALEAPVQVGSFPNYGRNEFGPRIVDADQDGDLDFFGTATIGSISSPAIFPNLGGGVFGPRAALTRYRNSPDATAIGDADGNGRPDVLLKPQGFGDWYLHLNIAPEGEDCNANGTLDSCDIASGQSDDADGNGVPDECQPPACPADIDGNGVLNVFDFLAFQTVFSQGEPAGDFDGNGVFNVFDFLAFQTAFSNGC